VRLENASWRTWAKQRGKLKTISPETLNWLKDSDVTWLYGPLHEHAEPVPPPKVASTTDRLDLDDSVRKKSILKHRTISEMLTTPGRSASPIIEYTGSSAEASQENSDTEGERGSRAPFFPVKSDTHLAQKRKKAGGSPPASERLFQNLLGGDKDDGIPHASPEERRHISFNQRVDQCIAVDVPEEEDEDEEEDDVSSDRAYYGDKQDNDDEDTPSSDEEVLTMKSSPRSNLAWPLTSHSSSQGSSPSLEHQTIAKLAPTLLKTNDIYPAPSPQVVDPTGFTDRGSTDNQATLTGQPHVYPYVNEQDEGMAQTRYSQWDADDDFSGDFDYFNGPDVSDNYEHSQPLPAGVPKDEVASKISSTVPATSPAGHDNGNDEHASVESSSAPRSILKKRVPVASNEGEGSIRSDDNLSPPVQKSQSDSPSSPQSVSSPTMGSSEERGRPSQRLGSSASYERVQDAGSLRTRSNSNNSHTSTSPSSSYDGVYANQAGSSSAGQQYTSTYGHKPSERRDSFRGRAGDGSKAMDGQQSGSYAAVAAGISKKQSSSSAAIDSDSDGRGSYDFNSPGYPASPLLGEKNEQGDGNEVSEAKLYGRKKDASKWVDSGRGKSGKRSLQSSRRDANDDDEEPARLSVDLDNLPPTTSANHSAAPGGPTPLNTPTMALARSRVSRSSKSSSSSSKVDTTAGDEGNSPDSPVLPRRVSATGALVAPSDADRDAGVRVPLAHDYVEEDEGGIVGRAVEIVNTARDLIGALLGTGGDRGRSWRESY
jgi:hypothetical protein